MLNDRILVFAIKLMIITLTALLNIFIVLIFSVFVKKKTFSDFIYLSIGVSDLIIGCLSMSTQLVSDIRADTTWPFDQISCVISIHLQYALPDTTLLALLILAVHFYLQLTTFSKPIENLNLVNCIKLLAPWCVATLFWLISISLMIKYDQFNAGKCIILPNFWFKFFKVAIFGYAPLISIIILNFVSIKKLNTRNKRFSNREIVQLIDIAQNKPSIMPTKTFSRSESNSNASSNANNNNNNNSNNDNDNNKNNNDNTNNNNINNNNVSFVHSLNSLKITHKAKTYLALSYLNRLFVVPGSNRKSTFVKRKSVFRYSMNRMSVYSRKNRRAVRCILALTFSITITQIVYLISWPLFDQSKETNNSKWISVMYDIGVWFSYLTSLFNPILLCLFNEKVKAHSRKILFRNNRKF